MCSHFFDHRSLALISKCGVKVLLHNDFALIILFVMNYLGHHIAQSTGVHLLENLHWDPSLANITIYCDACLSGMGFYVPHLHLGFCASTVDSGDEEFIFFHEALCVLSALAWVDQTYREPQRLILYTDNSNSVDIFNTLSASPRLNPILISACNISLSSFHDFKVLFIPGYQNTIADALSRFEIDKAHYIDRQLQIHLFQPPRVTLGSDL